MVPVFLSRWNFDPSIVGGIVLVGVAYMLQLRQTAWRSAPGARWRPLAFAAGLVTLAFALASPLDYLADHVSLLAHMLQHLLLLLVIPVLLLVGTPDRWLDAVRQVARSRWLCFASQPLTILGLALSTMWVWHAPALYEAALNDDLLHVAEHLCFLASSLLYWWPIARGDSCPWRLSDPLLIGYLFAAAVGGSMLAALITFSTDLLYPTYAQATAVALMHAWFGLTPSLDQQLAGLLMWVVGGIWYFGGAMIVLVRWFSRAVDDPVASPRGVPT